MIRTNYKMVQLSMQYAVSEFPQNYLMNVLENPFGYFIKDSFMSENYWSSASSIINFLVGASCLSDRFRSYTSSGINKRGRMLV